MSCNAAAFSRCFMKQAKGSSLTRARAATTWRALEKFAKEKKMILSPDKMTSKQLMRFVEYRVESGLSPRSIQNEVSHIRRALEGAERNLGNLKDQKNDWSGHRLKVPEGSRIGGKPPADKSAVHLVKRDDIRAVFELQSELGLRVREAIQSAHSLKAWASEIQLAKELGRGAWVRVVDGSKGGRPRSVWVPPSRLESVGLVLARAVQQSAKGRLVQAKDLKAAARACGRAASAAGFASHGLRRAWAVEQFSRYVAEGMDKKLALKRLSQDLGHGDGRGRWVWNNYLKVAS